MPTFRANLEVDETRVKSGFHEGLGAKNHWNLRFKAAFNVGESDTGITTVDADGVALAAIQGLNQKVEALRAENTDLKARLEKLERLIRPSK
jgi:hypothetical protein